jgi:hypothetical protein
MAAPALAQPNVFNQVQLDAAQATSVEIVGQATIIVSPDIVWLTNYYWKRIYNLHFCSGVVLWSKGRDAIVATARHCTMPEYVPDMAVDKPDPHDNWAVVLLSPKQIKFQDGNYGNVTSYLESTNSDVTILQVKLLRPAPAAYISKQPLYRGQPLLAYSMPAGFHFSALQAIATQGTDPLVEQIDPEDHDTFDFIHRYHWEKGETYVCPGCAPGVSGGPMYNVNGHVVGLTVGITGSLGVLMPAPFVEQTVKVFAENPKLRKDVFVPDKYDTCLLDTPYICEEYGVSGVQEGELPPAPSGSPADYARYHTQWAHALTNFRIGL